MHRYQRLIGNFITSVLKENLGKRILVLLGISVATTIFIFYHCVYTNSMALTAFAYLSIFNILRLCSSFGSIWIKRKTNNFTYSYGYDRFDVLSVFVCTAIAQLSGFFIFKESFERLIQQDVVIADSQISVVLLGSLVNIFITYGMESKAFAMVSRGASSNWLQDALFDFGKSICGSVPGLSRFLLIRPNPYLLLTHIAGVTVIIESLLVAYRKAYDADTISAMFIAVLLCVTMYPLSHHCAMILMHAAPKDLMASIDKCLKEANTLDGLLEFRKEHFWTISFGKYAGLLHVRVRRDANEQLILAQLTNKLSPYLHYVTIQIFKDDWRTTVTSPITNELHEPSVKLPNGAPAAARLTSPYANQLNDTPFASPVTGVTDARNILSSTRNYSPYAVNHPRLSTPYSHGVNSTASNIIKKPLIRYAPNTFLTSSLTNNSPKSNVKEQSLRSKYNGPRIDINFD